VVVKPDRAEGAADVADVRLVEHRRIKHRRIKHSRIKHSRTTGTRSLELNSSHWDSPLSRLALKRD
jgi:hypothetical protein